MLYDAIIQVDMKAWLKENIIGLVAIIVSIIALIRALTYKEPIITDWLGVLVGILSLLVMLLIGWNIYSVIDFNRIKKDTKKLNKDIGQQFKKLESDLKIDNSTTSIAIARMITEGNKGIVEGLSEALKCFKSYNSSFTITMMARERILAYLTEMIKQDIVKDISPLIREYHINEEIEFFLSEFLTYSKAEKDGVYKGVQELLLSLLSEDKISDNYNQET